MPTHHAVVNLPLTEQEELQQRIEAKAKQEQKKKGKQDTLTESTVVTDPDQSEDIQITLPTHTITMPRSMAVMMMDKIRGIIIGHLEIFPSLWEKVNIHSHTLWSLKIT